MPLPAPQVDRTPLHTRSIRVNVFARADDRLDLEAQLVDVKAYDFPVAKGTHRAGDPIHDMWLRVTIDYDYTITDAIAYYDAAPYGVQCMAITPDYSGLVGMNLLRGFRLAVKERFGRVAGCTHLSELTAVLPTAAIQAMSGRRRKTERPDQRPFHIDACHALREDGSVVQEYYPRWYVAPRVTNSA